MVDSTKGRVTPIPIPDPMAVPGNAPPSPNPPAPAGYDPASSLNAYSLRYAGYGYNQPGGYTPGIVTGTPADWFGPLNPMAPTAPPEVSGRKFDFPSGYNLNIEPRAYEPIKFPDLRALADSYDVLRTIIETRKDQVVRLSWNIKPRQNANGKNMVKPDDPVLTEIRDFFTLPDGDQFWDGWLREILEDLFVIDAPTLFIRRNRGGKMIGLDPIEGGSIKRVIDNWGRTPRAPLPAYQQELHGLPAVNYTTDQIIYRPRNLRVHKVYGYSPVEQIMMTVSIALRRQIYLLQYYTEGNVPEALVGAPDNWSSSQIKDFQSWFDGVLAGETGQRRRMRFVPGGVGKTFINPKEGALTGETDEWLTRVCCFAFSISPTPFIKQVSRANADSQKEQAQEEGLAPIQQWIKSLIDFIIFKEWKRRDVEFSWELPDDVDAGKQATILTDYVKTGIFSINMALDKLAEDPIEGGDQHLALLPTGWVPIAPTNQFGAAGGAQGVGLVDDKVKADGNKTRTSGANREDLKPPGNPGDKEEIAPTPPASADAKPPGSNDEAVDTKPEPGQPDTTPGPAPKVKKGVGQLAEIPFGKGLRKRSPPKFIAVAINRPGVERIKRSAATKIHNVFKHMGRKAAEHISQSLKQLGKASIFNNTEARGIAESVDLNLLDGLPSVLQQDLAQSYTSAVDEFLSNFGPYGPLEQQAESMAADWARRRAAELVGLQYNSQLELVPYAGAEMSIRSTTVNMLERAIQSGIDEGLTADAISAGIETAIFGTDRAALIANAEVNRAGSNGIAAAAQLAGTLGYNTKKSWETSDDSLVCADICQLNEMDGFIGMNEYFTSGDFLTPGHPRCRCNVMVQVL